ncbi:hypothetical protein GA0074696_2853 [Micromonospora purpureochromogenes]|uniref:Uncharacterized protein n=1 Tax=Micromonospora purpureochromogenes TaxID=47872 RepID=A0A1C4XUK3_9ACTN|nr:hypothetical protein [Micromonospora purpureochromogenes]SCF12092.1 hypothetical protein GA0074696_2853 [Micromonospora purpureochromogenes]
MEAGLVVEAVRMFGPQQVDVATAGRNEDWLRTTGWNLPARSLGELWPVLGVTPSASDEERRRELRRFMALPVWRAAPAGLRTEAARYLGEQE